MNELKPCPFCGCSDTDRHQDGSMCQVRCMNCGCLIEGNSFEDCESDWNTREDFRKRFACEHWDNSEAPEEYCLLYCRLCNGPCEDWKRRNG